MNARPRGIRLPVWLCGPQHWCPFKPFRWLRRACRQSFACLMQINLESRYSRRGTFAQVWRLSLFPRSSSSDSHILRSTELNLRYRHISSSAHRWPLQVSPRMSHTSRTLQHLPLLSYQIGIISVGFLPTSPGFDCSAKNASLNACGLHSESATLALMHQFSVLQQKPQQAEWISKPCDLAWCFNCFLNSTDSCDLSCGQFLIRREPGTCPLMNFPPSCAEELIFAAAIRRFYRSPQTQYGGIRWSGLPRLFLVIHTAALVTLSFPNWSIVRIVTPGGMGIAHTRSKT